ncbi:MAG TPA: hypothetical protein VLM11_16040 [Streptosporangiaceae bacterium]|nr:hypothetical protein [Streptosporangiaceae bacterium]
MTRADDGPTESRLTARAGRRRAAGIYGAIITPAIMTASGADLAATPLALSVLVTLIMYWLAEQYAEMLGEPDRLGHWPRWSHVRASLADSSPTVSSFVTPIAILILARLAGASAADAANAGVAAGPRNTGSSLLFVRERLAEPGLLLPR